MKKMIVCLLAVIVAAVTLGCGTVFATESSGADTAAVTEAAGNATEAPSGAETEEFVDTKDSFQLSDILRVPFSYVIRFAYRLIPNYAVALLLFAIVMKALLFPLSIKQQKNMVKQAALRPKENAIRKRYAGRTDRPTQQKMQSEIMDLYQRENFNPMGGCLPLLLQFPILIALYNVIIHPLKYLCGFSTARITAIQNEMTRLYTLVQEGSFTPVGKLSETILKRLESGTAVSKLSGIEQVNVIRYLGEDNFRTWLGDTVLPDFTLGPLNLSLTPNFTSDFILLLIPVLTFVIAFFSMRLTRKMSYQPEQTADQAMSMKMMDFTMPLVSVWITFTVPAVVGIYWIYQNILSVVQQFILKKMYPIPTFTDEELARIEKEMNGKVRPKREADAPAGGKKKVRSLHHIDDDDYPDTQKKKKAQGAEAEKPSDAEDTDAPSQDRPPISPAVIPPARMKGEDDRKES